MANVMLRKKIDVQTPAVSGVKRYARKIWLAGLGAYAKVGSEGGEYFKELVKSGQRIESKSKKKLQLNKWARITVISTK